MYSLFTNTRVAIPVGGSIESVVGKLRSAVERTSTRSRAASDLSGTVSPDNVRLHLVGLLPHRPYQPVFRGHFVVEPNSIVLLGSIRSSLLLRAFTISFLGFSGLWTLGALYASMRPGEDPAAKWLPVAGLVFIAAATGFFHLVNVFVQGFAEQLRKRIEESVV